jgi:hypothetical protein
MCISECQNATHSKEAGNNLFVMIGSRSGAQRKENGTLSDMCLSRSKNCNGAVRQLDDWHSDGCYRDGPSQQGANASMMNHQFSIRGIASIEKLGDAHYLNHLHQRPLPGPRHPLPQSYHAVSIDRLLFPSIHPHQHFPGHSA